MTVREGLRASFSATVSASALLIGTAAAAQTTTPPEAVSPPTSQIAPPSTSPSQEQPAPAGAPVGATEQGDAAGQAADGDGAQDIVVTGFRSSLQKALNVKKTEAGAVDAILA